MEWLWDLYQEYVIKYLQTTGDKNPTGDALYNTFIKILSESTVTILVQEPWRNSVRFKGLAKYGSQEMIKLIKDPLNFLQENFGGGKFKLNFHHGWNFVGTRDFKPPGESRWQDLPNIEF